VKIILADLQSNLIQAWNDITDDTDIVTTYQGSIFDVECDALVSPANSFGFMDGGIDLKISEFFGWHVQGRLQELIRTKHHGELLVGQAEIVNTNHSQIPYVISAPTMRVPMILENTANVYLAVRAVLILVKYDTFEDGTPIKNVVTSIAFPGMGTGVGKVPPHIFARQMKKAVADVIDEKHVFPESWGEAQKRHQLLYSDSYRDLQYGGEQK
jgi:O-acetyl-ADP-ribose deacetylase (regulator of RNase III)